MEIEKDKVISHLKDFIKNHNTDSILNLSVSTHNKYNLESQNRINDASTIGPGSQDSDKD
jgi:hypothetical protein